MLLIVAASIVFCGLLFLYFEFTIQGKALRATAINRAGARLVGIRPDLDRHDRLPAGAPCWPASRAC